MKKLILLFVTILLLPALCFADMNPYVAGIVAASGSSDLLFYWDCDVTGSAPFTPNTGTGTITENVTVTSTSSGCTGNAFTTDGSSSNSGSLTVNSANIDLDSGQLDICIIPAYTGAPPSSCYILIMTPTSGAFNLKHASDGFLYFNYGDSDSEKVAFSPTSGTSYNIKLTYGANHKRIFIDGVGGTEDTSVVVPTGATDWYISGSVWSPKFNGTIDEIYIYDTIQ